MIGNTAYSCDESGARAYLATQGWQPYTGQTAGYWLGTAPCTTTTSGTTVTYACAGYHNGTSQGNVSQGMTPSAGTCGANSTASGSTCTCTGTNVVNPAQNACEAPGACNVKLGTSTTTYFTMGWLHNVPTTAGQNVWPDAVGFASAPSTACQGGCSSTVGAPVPIGSSGSDAYVSLTPSANGLYRISSARVVTFNGASCTIGTSDSNNPNAPLQGCDGYLGTVNGVTRCVAPVPGGGASSPALNPFAGNPAAGGDGTKPLDDPTVSPPAGSASGGGDGGNKGGPPGMGGKPTNPVGGSGSGGSTGGGGGGLAGGGAVNPGTGASGGGSSTTGSTGKNTEGGDCSSNPSAAGCGGAAAADASIYTKKTATFGQALTDFKNTVSGSAIGTSIGGYFTVAGGGTCPTFSASIPWFGGTETFTFDQLCSSWATNAFAFLKIAFLVVAGVAAFRIAML